jgi:glyoxylase-like metal-dependent hydrolase (beta-lactamase superfamily II)
MRMRIHALSTGSVEITNAMARGRGRGPLRLLRAVADRTYTGRLPIHAWLIEHPDGPILVDAGELSDTADPPIARFHVDRDEEIDRQLHALGLGAGDLAAVVLTHLHGDHRNGLARLSGARVLVSADALARGGTRWLRRHGIVAEPLRMTGGPFGAFERSAPVTQDGRVVAVPVPGHARGQLAVVVVEPEHHVLLAGDSAYTEAQLLDLQVDGVSMSARAAIASMRTIIEHARRHPTVFLPSHDPQSASRLRARTAVQAA